jgi:YebC/PmpR family DNA-binding regulatory protein
MSGHNKWSQIKHKKEISDAKKGHLFGKLAKAITIAARDNPDPAANARLKTEIDRARAVNMPNDNIERAIRRVTDKGQAALTEVQLEFIGPGGAGVIAIAITDNSNRTINELKTLVSSHGARMVAQNSILWMFRKSGTEMEVSVPVPLSEPAHQQQLESLLEALDEHDDVQNVYTNAEY